MAACKLPSMTNLYVIMLMVLVFACVSLAKPVGVWTDQGMWDLAKSRLNTEPWKSLYAQTLGRADLNAVPNPFHLDDMTRPISQGGIYYGWKTGGANTLSEAGGRLQEAGWRLQAYAIAYTFTKDAKYAIKLLEYMNVWAAQHTPVNMFDFNIDFVYTNFTGIYGTDFQTDRPWNFALDCMWQNYGLKGMSDAYLLLKNSGYAMGAQNDTNFRNWIKSVTSAVNSGFLSWTKWADAHPTSGAIVRYRSDNHLSWSMTGLLAAGVALGDTDLVNYVIEGGAWKDIKAPLYKNPSPFKEMISMAIQPGTGLMYEQLIGRTPLIGYSYFHIDALMELAIMGQIHTGQDLFNYVGRNGTTLKLAYQTYAKYALGQATSTDPAEANTNFGNADGWLYELAVDHWPTETNFKTIVSKNGRQNYILQGVGPWALFWADYPMNSASSAGTTTATAATSAIATTAKASTTAATNAAATTATTAKPASSSTTSSPASSASGGSSTGTVGGAAASTTNASPTGSSTTGNKESAASHVSSVSVLLLLATLCSLLCL